MICFFLATSHVVALRLWCFGLNISIPLLKCIKRWNRYITPSFNGTLVQYINNVLCIWQILSSIKLYVWKQWWTQQHGNNKFFKILCNSIWFLYVIVSVIISCYFYKMYKFLNHDKSVLENDFHLFYLLYFCWVFIFFIEYWLIE